MPSKDKTLPLTARLVLPFSRLAVPGVHARADITTPFLVFKYSGNIAMVDFRNAVAETFPVNEMNAEVVGIIRGFFKLRSWAYQLDLFVLAARRGIRVVFGPCCRSYRNMPLVPECILPAFACIVR